MRTKLVQLGAAVAALVVVFGFTGHALATVITSNLYSGNGHNGVTFQLDHALTFNGFSGNWNPTYADSYMTVTNGGSALCDRNRLFEQGWTQFANLNYAGAPFPFSSGATQYDYFNHNGRVSLWALRSWWQVDDRFSGVTCDYGGGAGVYKASNAASFSSEIVPSP